MNSYTDFAFIYDRLMKQDIDYEQLADYIENLFSLYDCNPDLIAELACGTGNITLPLAMRGYDMIGIDLSQTMLSVARDKAEQAQTDILFLNQNMLNIDLYGTADAFLCMIDGINYILAPQSLLQMLSRIKNCFLNPGGLFICECSSAYKLSHTLNNHTFIHNERDIFYSWQNRYFPSKKLCDMYLNFFVRTKQGYKRFEERHLQRAYTQKELTCLFQKAGFGSVDFYQTGTFHSPAPDAERLTLVAR